MRLAAVTMAFNEAEYLPLWLRHYGRQVGLAHCHVIDHGSTDGSTSALGGASRLALPRSAHDDERRARFVANYCAGLLEWYDAVLFSDVDELVVADPALYADLPALVAECDGAVLSAVGFNLLHLSAEEPGLDFAAGLGAQRRWAWFTSAMCKPVLVRRRVDWAPGFHSADAPVQFAPMFLFHARYADRATALRRLARTRAMPWANLAGGGHQRVADEEFGAMLDRLERMDRVEGVVFDAGSAPLAAWVARVLESQDGRQDQRYRIALDLENYALWNIPDALRIHLSPADAAK